MSIGAVSSTANKMRDKLVYNIIAQMRWTGEHTCMYACITNAFVIRIHTFTAIK